MKNSGGILTFQIPDEIISGTETLRKGGFEAFLIGGCVRDLLLGRKPKDWDITTNAKPEEIIKIFPETFYENDYGTVGVVNKNTEDETLKVIEITPYRTEGKYSDNRRPDNVDFGATINDDLKRRDFTINALALNIVDSDTKKGLYKATILDLFGGIKDLNIGTIKAVGNPTERFGEDALRIIRAIRIATELGFSIEKETESAIGTTAELLKNIASERIREEFLRIIMSDNPMMGLNLCRKLGVMKFILPELEESIGVDQNQAHSYDVWEHTLRSLQHGAEKKWNKDVRLATLLHDIGKPATRKWSDEKKDWTFHGHDVVGAKIAEKALKRLHFSSKEVEKITTLVRWHMFFSDTEIITLSAVRRMVNRVGKENMSDLMQLRMCDRIGTGRPKESPYRLRKYQSMIEEAMRDPISVSMLKIDGGKIMNVTKLNPGPKIGYILNALLEEVLENPKLNTEENLEKMALNMVNLSDNELKKLGEKAKENKEKKEETEVEQIRKKYWVK